MINVFFTVDVEIWCGSWRGLDASFAEAFRKYIYGPTPHGDYGLPRTLKLLSEHELQAVFFIEPLFATRFGLSPLQEIVELIHEAGQEVQLHLHTEWVDESLQPLLPGITHKRQYLSMFDMDEQRTLICKGIELLKAAGAENINAFRAGSFGMNSDTLLALAELGIAFDASYNPTRTRPNGGLSFDHPIYQPTAINGVIEYPMTVFADRPGHYRHAQLGACSFSELQWLLWHAAEEGWGSVTILSHNFELMNQHKDRPDPIVNRRLEKLCKLLSDNTDIFSTQGFQGLEPCLVSNIISPPHSPLYLTALRTAEQVLRRVYR